MVNDNTNYFSNAGNVNVWNNYRYHCRRSVSTPTLGNTLSPNKGIGDIQERHFDNVGEWLIQTEEFRKWCGSGGEVENDSLVLFCYGDPGR